MSICTVTQPRKPTFSEIALALRVIAAHMLTGSELWHVTAEPQRAAVPEIAEGLARNRWQEAMEAERKAIAKLIDGEPQSGCIAIENIFAKLQVLSDDEVALILAYLMAKTLSVHSPLIDTLGQTMGTQMRDY